VKKEMEVKIERRTSVDGGEEGVVAGPKAVPRRSPGFPPLDGEGALGAPELGPE
jgi:hypothetical protein